MMGNEKILQCLRDMQDGHFISVTAVITIYNTKETTVSFGRSSKWPSHQRLPTASAIYLKVKKRLWPPYVTWMLLVYTRILALRGDIIPGVEPLKDFE